jgi:prepilin-type N-terminal cleavage/methylation domain-containing protein
VFVGHIFLFLSLIETEKTMNLKQFTQPQKGIKKQRGFTMLEMMIVLAIIAAVIGIGSSIYDRQVSNAKITSAQAFIERTYITALTSCYTKRRNYNQCMQTAGSATTNMTGGTGSASGEGLEPLTEWDGNWSTTYNSGAGTISMTYAATDDTAGDLAVQLTSSKSKYVTNAVANGSNVTITIKAP